MSNEIQFRHTATGSSDLYAVVFDADGKACTDPAGTPTFEAPATASWGNYDIPLAEYGTASQVYRANFPAVDAGMRMVRIYEKSGTPAASDSLLGEGEIRWDGAAEVNEASIDSTDTEDISIAKALEILLGCAMGKTAFTASTGVWSIKGRDGVTEIATLTVSGSGNRSASGIS